MSRQNGNNDLLLPALRVALKTDSDEASIFSPSEESGAARDARDSSRAAYTTPGDVTAGNGKGKQGTFSPVFSVLNPAAFKTKGGRGDRNNGTPYYPRGGNIVRNLNSGERATITLSWSAPLTDTAGRWLESMVDGSLSDSVESYFIVRTKTPKHADELPEQVVLAVVSHHDGSVATLRSLLEESGQAVTHPITRQVSFNDPTVFRSIRYSPTLTVREAFLSSEDERPMRYSFTDTTVEEGSDYIYSVMANTYAQVEGLGITLDPSSPPEGQFGTLSITPKTVEMLPQEILTVVADVDDFGQSDVTWTKTGGSWTTRAGVPKTTLNAVPDVDGKTTAHWAAADTLPGTTHRIQATSVADPSVKDFTSVTVNPNAAPKVWVSPAVMIVRPGGVVHLGAVVTGAADHRVVWSTPNLAQGLLANQGGTLNAESASTNINPANCTWTAPALPEGESSVQIVVRAGAIADPSHVFGEVKITVEKSGGSTGTGTNASLTFAPSWCESYPDVSLESGSLSYLDVLLAVGADVSQVELKAIPVGDGFATGLPGGGGTSGMITEQVEREIVCPVTGSRRMTLHFTGWNLSRMAFDPTKVLAARSIPATDGGSSLTQISHFSNFTLERGGAINQLLDVYSYSLSFDVDSGITVYTGTEDSFNQCNIRLFPNANASEAVLTTRVKREVVVEPLPAFDTEFAGRVATLGISKPRRILKGAAFDKISDWNFDPPATSPDEVPFLTLAVVDSHSLEINIEYGEPFIYNGKLTLHGLTGDAEASWCYVRAAFAKKRTTGDAMATQSFRAGASPEPGISMPVPASTQVETPTGRTTAANLRPGDMIIGVDSSGACDASVITTNAQRVQVMAMNFGVPTAPAGDPWALFSLTLEQNAYIFCEFINAAEETAQDWVSASELFVDDLTTPKYRVVLRDGRKARRLPGQRTEVQDAYQIGVAGANGIITNGCSITTMPSTVTGGSPSESTELVQNRYEGAQFSTS